MKFMTVFTSHMSIGAKLRRGQHGQWPLYYKKINIQYKIKINRYYLNTHLAWCHLGPRIKKKKTSGRRRRTKWKFSEGEEAEMPN